MKKLFTLIAVAVMAFAAQANELTVCDYDMAYQYAPVYGYWYDAEGMSQMIYPAEMLAEMNGGKITELKFYTCATWGEGWEDYGIGFAGGNIQLALKEVDEVGFNGTEDVISGATVVAATVPENGGLYLTFVLDEPFQYNGGNLLVEASWDGTGTWGRTYFVCVDELDYNPTYYGYDYYGDWTDAVVNIMPKCTFTYEAGQVTPPEPTEKTGAPVFNGYTTDGIHAYFIEILESEPSTIYYRVQYGQDGEFTEWAEYEDILSFTQDGWYRIEAYAVADGKLPSDPIAYEFIVNPATGLSEMVGSKTVASTRYFNVAGQEMQEANGLTIVVTTYTDGTTSTVKVMK